MKKITLGIIIGILLATALPAAAEEITKKVMATVRGDFSVEVDGKEVMLQNAPLAYDGSSYLPVRELANLLGKDVDFKDGVIKLNTPIETPLEEFVVPEGYTAEEFYHELTVDKGRALIEIEMVEKALETAETKRDKTTMEELLQYSKGKLEKIEQQLAALLEQYPELAE